MINRRSKKTTVRKRRRAAREIMVRSAISRFDMKNISVASTMQR